MALTLFWGVGGLLLVLTAWLLRRMRTADPVQRAWLKFCAKPRQERLRARGARRPRRFCRAHGGALSRRGRAARRHRRALHRAALRRDRRCAPAGGAAPAGAGVSRLMRASRLLARLLLAWALASPVTAAAGASAPYAGRKTCAGSSPRWWTRHGFAAKELRTLFGRARFQPAIIAAITPPLEPRARSWQAYRALFLTPSASRRAQPSASASTRRSRAPPNSMACPRKSSSPSSAWRRCTAATPGQLPRHRRAVHARIRLPAAPRNSSVPNWRTTCCSRAMPHRHPGFEGIVCRRHRHSAFMPGSYRRYAVDLTATAKQDLSGSFADAIAASPTFSRRTAGSPGRPVAYPAQVQGEQYHSLVTPASSRTTALASCRSSASARKARPARTPPAP